ncbi:MAG: hypothetical protein Kow0074_24030 [Candidatus Zixiibacteriota bacterium]
MRIGPLVAAQDANALGGEIREYLPLQHPVLLGNHLVCDTTDLSEQQLRGQAVLIGVHDPERDLLLATRHPNLEEFVEIGAADRQKTQFLEQWYVWIAGQLQDTAVELKEAQFTIDVQARVVQVDFGIAAVMGAA